MNGIKYDENNRAVFTDISDICTRLKGENVCGRKNETISSS
jgi:hypothetical protein